MKRFMLISLGFLLIFSLILGGGCQAPAEDVTPGVAPEEDVEPVEEVDVDPEEAIVIGAIVSLSGMNAANGADQRWAYEEAVADINADGGVMVEELGKKLPVEIVFADDRSEPAAGAEAMEQLVNVQNVDLVLGSCVTPINIAAATVAEKYEAYFSACITWVCQFGDEEFEWASDFFFSAASGAEVPFIIMDTVPEEERPQRVGIMMEDNPDGQGFADGFRMWSEEYGYEIVVDEAYTPGARDYSSSVLRMRENDVDAFLWLGSPTDSILLVRQMKDHNFAPKYIHGWKGFWHPEFLEALGDDTDYIVHDGFWAETLPHPGAEELGQRYRDDHGGVDSVSVGPSYANVQIMAEAIERAGSIEPAKVRDEVFGGSFTDTVMGDIHFGEDGIYETPSLALQWYQGERMPVLPDVDFWELEWHPGWN